MPSIPYLRRRFLINHGALGSNKRFVIMPKMKSHSGAKKRFSLTSKGKVKRRRSGLRHILTKKSKKRKRLAGTPALVHENDAPRVKHLLGK